MTKLFHSTKVLIALSSLFLAIFYGCGGQNGKVQTERASMVTGAILMSIAVTPANSSIAKETTQQFTATGIYSDGTALDLTAQVVWSASDTSVTTISTSGLAASVAAGSATITAVFGSISGTTSLTVTSATTAGSATLAWDAPTTNIDGTPLTDLTGYKIYFGTSSGNYTSVIDVGNITTYTVSNLSSGTYYFAVRSYDASGIESDFSNEASKSIL